MNKTSKGEQKIINLLLSGGIKFEREYTFKNLHGQNNSLLRFDFAIFNNRNKLIACIEFDGKQHFQYTPYFHKNKFAFQKQQEWDRKKNKYCLLNNIPLIRIPYWDLEDLTLQKIFYSPAYRVKNKYHNDMLKEVSL